jgi:hypothetical protein
VADLGFVLGPEDVKEGSNFTLWDEGPVTVKIKTATKGAHKRLNEETGAQREYVELTYEALDGNHVGTTATERFNVNGWTLTRHTPGKEPDRIGRSQLRLRAHAIGLKQAADIDNLIGNLIGRVLVLNAYHEEGKQLKKDGTPFVFLRFKSPRAVHAESVSIAQPAGPPQPQPIPQPRPAAIVAGHKNGAPPPPKPAARE